MTALSRALFFAHRAILVSLTPSCFAETSAQLPTRPSKGRTIQAYLPAGELFV